VGSVHATRRPENRIGWLLQAAGLTLGLSGFSDPYALKWCATAALVLVVVFIASIWLNSAIVNVLQTLAFVGLWTAIAVAVLKYRLYDIGRIISRTLAYAIVTGVLVGL
jgi:hypothetical protein